MKKSNNVGLGLLLAAVLGVTGCDETPQEVKRCLDQNGNAVPESRCQDQDKQWETNGRPAYVPGRPWPYIYRWNYGGVGGYNYGDHVTGGRSTPSEGSESISAAHAGAVTGSRGGSGTVSRGGFGGGFHGGFAS